MSFFDLIATLIPKDAENESANGSAASESSASTQHERGFKLEKVVEKSIAEMQNQQLIDKSFVLAVIQNNDVMAKAMLAAGKKPSAGLLATDGKPIDEKIKDMVKGADEPARAAERQISLPASAIAQLNSVQADVGSWANLVTSRGQASQSLPMQRSNNWSMAV
jgi:hypothetical protein